MSQPPTEPAGDPQPALAETAHLGPLEQQIMDYLWDHDSPATVRDIHTGLAGRRERAYTTIQTVTQRLHDKGLLTAWKKDRAWLFHPKHTRGWYVASALAAILATCDDSGTALAQFVALLSLTDRQTLRKALGLAPDDPAEM